MTSEQRKMIVHPMSQFYDLRQIAELNDDELRVQYNKMCQTGECDLKPRESQPVQGT